MNIEKWDIEKIMRLPDWCFGTRYVLACSAYGANAAYGFDMSEISLPNRGVLWQLTLHTIFSDSSSNYMKIARGNKLPATEAEFNLLKPFVTGLGQAGAEPRQLVSYPSGQTLSMSMKMPIESVGGRLIIAAYGQAAKSTRIRVVAVVSGIPKEVPDWLNLGQADWRW